MRTLSRRTFIKVAAILVIIYLSVIVSLGFVVRSDWFIGQVKSRLKKGLGRRVTFSSITPSLWLGVGARVRDFTVYEEDGKTPFLQSDKIFMRVALLPLVWKELRIASVSLDRPRLALVRDEKGKWNFESLAEREKPAVERVPGRVPAKKKGKGRFSIARLRVRDGRITAKDPSWSRQLVIKGLNVTAADITPGSLPYVDGGGTIEDLPIAGLLSGVRELRRYNVTGGVLSGKFTLKGWIARKLDFWTQLKAEGIHFSYGRYGTPPSGLDVLVEAEGDGSYGDDVWNIRSLRARLIGGRVETRGSVLGLGRAPELDVRVSGRAVQWKELGNFDMPRLSLGGAMGLDATLKGMKGEMAIDATLDFGETALAYGGLLEKKAGVKTVISLPAKIDGGTLTWKNAKVRVGVIELISEGEIERDAEPRLRMKVEGSDIDMAGLGDLLRREIVTEGRGTCDVLVEQPLDRPFSVAAVSGSASVSAGRIRLPSFAKPIDYDAVLSIKGGRGRLGLSTVRLGSSVAEGRIDFDLRDRPTFDCDFNLPRVNTADFASSTARAESASRVFPLVIVAGAEAAAGSIPRERPFLPPFARRISGAGRISVGELLLGKLRAEKGMVKFRVSEGVVETEELDFSLYGGSARGGFVADMGGATPAYSLRVAMADVDAAALLADLYEYRDIVSGTMFVECEAAGTGNDWISVQKTIEAAGRFSVREGVIRSFGVVAEMGSLFTLLGRQAKAKEFVAIGNVLSRAPAEARLSRCEGDFTFKSGRWGTGNLLLEIASRENPLRLQLKGTMAPDGVIDLLGYVAFPRGSTCYAMLADDFPDEGGWIRVPFPVPIGGTLERPRVNLESAQKAIRTAAAEIGKLRLRKEVEKKIDKALAPKPKKEGEPPGVEDLSREILRGAAKEMLKKLLE